MPTLSLRSVSRSFGDALVVDNADLEVASGEFVSLLGPSGCGKTTTLRMIAGFIDPSAGTIALDDRTLSSPGGSIPPEKRGMSMIFQSYAIWPNMTVAENVAFGLKIRRLGRAEIEDKVKAILDVVQLSPLRDRYPAELSGGQQQRIALARAIVVNPAVLLLDEPLSNLDANLREDMRFEIRRLHDEFKFTTIYVTHDQGEAMVTSDRVAVMNKGRIEQIDTPIGIYTQPKTRFVASFLGKTNLLEGTRKGRQVAFDGFEVDVASVAEASANAAVAYSLRPHCVRLVDKGSADSATGLRIDGRIAKRAFLGDRWDYVVSPAGSASQLRVSARPAQAFEVNALVWIEIDPQDLVALDA